MASQNQMLINRNKPTDEESQARMAILFRKHLSDIKDWLKEQPNFDVLYLYYHEVLDDPRKYCTTINRFLGNRLNETRARAVVDKKLYRQQQ